MPPDVITVSGDTVTRNVAPPKSVEVEMPPPAATAEPLPQDGEDIRLKRISDPIELSVDGRELRDEIRSRKGDSEDPIYEWKAEQAMPPPGEHERFGTQIKCASESMHSARMAALGETYSRLLPITREQGDEVADAVVQAKPVKITPVGDLGQPLVALDDHQPVGEEDSFRNVAEANRAMKNLRDAQDRQREQLLADIQAAEAQQAASREQAEPARQGPAASPPQPQPDVNQERARMEAQWRQVQAQQYWNQLGAAEQAAANEIAQLEQWTQANYHPQELQNPHLIRDAERAHWLEQGAARFRELNQGLRNASTLRAAGQTQAAAAYQQSVSVWGKQQDDLF